MIDTLIDSGKIVAGGGIASLAMPAASAHSSVVEQIVTYALPFVMSFVSHLILHLITKKSNGNSESINP